MVKKYVMEFKEFIKEYAIVGMAIAFVMGAATKDLVKSLVNDLVMPLLVPVIPGEAWQEATFTLGPIILRWGSFLSALINFVILALVVFFIAKKILKEEKVKKK
ncbi:large conductance mechanosensitive channel protein MscL [Candidatus Woesearchaeota archaeon]|nr:large conductance mechanosensitive channel protein MscL [Candidatus Woesearchaeota archaeon]